MDEKVQSFFYLLVLSLWLTFLQFLSRANSGCTFVIHFSAMKYYKAKKEKGGRKGERGVLEEEEGTKVGRDCQKTRKKSLLLLNRHFLRFLDYIIF